MTDIFNSLIDRVLALAALRGDMTGRGSMLDDYDRGALAALVEAAVRPAAAAVGLVMTDGPEKTFANRDGSPATASQMARLENEVFVRMAAMLGINAPAVVVGPLPSIRPYA